MFLPGYRLGLRAWLCAAALVSGAGALAQTPPSPDRELRAGVFEAPPYAMKGASGEWRGLTVDLWKRLAADLGWRYRFAEISEGTLLDAVASGAVDLAAAPFAATMDRQLTVDFSHTYLTTGIAMAVRARGRMERLLDLFRTLAASEAAHILIAIALLTLLFGAAIWLAERHRNPQFPARPVPGIGSGVWWASVTTTSVGYGDKVPITLRGRVLAAAWMVVSLVLTVVLTAGLTATLAVARFEETRGPESLRRVTAGAVDGSAAADFLRNHGIRRKLYATFEVAVDALARREVDAVVFNEEVLRYYALHDRRSPLEVFPQSLMSVSLAFPLPDRSALRDPLNAAMRRALADPRWRDLRDRYLGSAAAGSFRKP